MTVFAFLVASWVDVTLLGGPAYYPMLEYRAKVVGRNVSRMVVLQGNLSYSGVKQAAVPKHWIARLKTLVPGGVTVLNVPFPEKVASQWDRERIHRWHAVQWLVANEPNTVAYIADGDEIINPKLGVDNLISIGKGADCIRPRLRSSYYSPCCEMGNPTWTKSVLVRTASKTFKRWTSMSPAAVNDAIRDPDVECDAAPGGSLRSWLHDHVGGLVRPDPDSMQGWHMSYALDTRRIREKLSSFSHSKDKPILSALGMTDGEFSQRIKNCQNILNKDTGKEVEDGPFPPPGWPHHPDAPVDCGGRAGRSPKARRHAPNLLYG